MRDFDIVRTNPAAYAARFELRSPAEREAYVRALSPPDLELHLTALVEALLARSARVRRFVVELRSSRGRAGPFDLRIGIVDATAEYPVRSLLELAEVGEDLRMLLFARVASIGARLRVERPRFDVTLREVRWRRGSLDERIARVRALFPDAAVTALHVGVSDPHYDRSDLIEGAAFAGLELGSARAEVYAALDLWSYEERESVIRGVNAMAKTLGVPAGDRHALSIDRGDRTLAVGVAEPRALVVTGERLYWAALDRGTSRLARVFDRTPRGMISSARLDGSDPRVHARRADASWILPTPRGTLAYGARDCVWTIEAGARTEPRAEAPFARLPGDVSIAPTAVGDDLVVVCEVGRSSVIVRVDGATGAVETLVTREGRTVTGAAAVADRLVWSEREPRALMIARLDGSAVRRVEGVSALAIAPLGADVVVLESERLARVPVDGGPARALAGVSLLGEPERLVATPGAVFIALKASCVSDIACGAALVRVQIPDGHAETIYSAPPGPGTSAEEIVPASPSIAGMVAHDGTLYFAERGVGAAASGSIRAIRFDRTPVFRVERRLPSSDGACRTNG